MQFFISTPASSITDILTHFIYYMTDSSNEKHAIKRRAIFQFSTFMYMYGTVNFYYDVTVVEFETEYIYAKYMLSELHLLCMLSSDGYNSNKSIVNFEFHMHFEGNIYIKCI